MAIPSLSIDALRNDQNAKITIIMKNQGKVTIVSGFTMGEFSLSGNASYNNPFENSGQQKLSDIIAQVTTSVNAIAGTNFSQFQLKNQQQTVSLWSASGKPSFSVTMLFVQLRSVESHGNSVLEPVKKLNAGVYPIVKNDFQIIAPLGYTIKGKTVLNTNSLRIGRWFHARSLIMTAASPTFSQEVVANGTPLYAQVQVTFEPYRAVDVNEVNKWFRTGR